MTDIITVDINISGMTCAMCVQAVETALLKADGVTSAAVNLASEKATVGFDSGITDISTLEDVIENTGYTVLSNQSVLKIGGMTCAMCVQALEKALTALPGVTEVNVNLASEKAYVSHYPGITDIADLKKTVADTGYRFLGTEEDPSDIRKREHEKDLKRKKLRMLVGFPVSIILFILMHVHMNLPFHMSYLMLIIATPAFLYVGAPIFLAAWHALRIRNLNMDVMYAMGIGVAFTASLLGTFEIVLDRTFMFYEASVMLATFLTLGRFLESRARGKTSDALKKLIGLQSHTALLVKEGKEEEIPIEQVQAGDLIRVKAGEKFPVDGTVEEGTGYVDESMISGEPVPVLKEKEAPVFAGTISTNSVLTFKAEKIGKETLLSQIIALVEQAQGSKPPIQRAADRAVTWFIPFVLSVAVITFTVWMFVPEATLLNALTRLIAVLVIACPCALGLATPTAVTVGVGRGAELGILIKNGEALERSSRLTTVVFDKTGTLTTGKPAVSRIIGINEHRAEVLKTAACLETNSSHPLAGAVIRESEEKGIDAAGAENFTEYPGRGIEGELNGIRCFAGTLQFMKDNNISLSVEAAEKAHETEQQGETAILIARDNTVIGVIGIADPLRNDSVSAVRRLKDLGLKTAMVTGDNRTTAQAVAKEAGIDTVLAEVLPSGKADEIIKIQESGETAAFIGDGINDAPALAQADVGIAMGSGTDVALESGDIVLVKSTITAAAGAVELARKVMKRIRQNLFWAFAYNTALIPVAAGVLQPLFGISFRPELAGAAMALSSVTVVSLSLLLKRYTPESLKGNH